MYSYDLLNETAEQDEDVWLPIYIALLIVAVIITISIGILLVKKIWITYQKKKGTQR